VLSVVDESSATGYNPPVMHSFAAVKILAQEITIVAVEIVFLYALSRILFDWVLKAFATRSHGGGWFIKALRLPGNAVHEVSHAIGYLIFGYRIRDLDTCITDPKGRGACHPGPAWSPIAFPWLATAAAAAFPLLMGPLVLRGLASVLDIPFTTGKHQPNDGATLFLFDSLRATLHALNFHDWRTYLFLILAFSVGAELAPARPTCAAVSCQSWVSLVA
jgi:hypothetical protein